MIIPSALVESSPILRGLDSTVLSVQAEALEQSIRRYTHNNFRARGSKLVTPVSASGAVLKSSPWYSEGDRVEVLGGYSPGLYTVVSVEEDRMVLDAPLLSEEDVTVWKIHYPADVLMGMVRILEHRNDAKAQSTEGLASQTLSRHSVTYKTDHNASNGMMDYPARLTGFLKAHMRARF